eukprot:1110696-Alexandrium_andersonii.AAC.1
MVRCACATPPNCSARLHECVARRGRAPAMLAGRESVPGLWPTQGTLTGAPLALQRSVFEVFKTIIPELFDAGSSSAPTASEL